MMYVRRKSIQDNQLPRHLQIAATGEIEIGEKIHVDCGFWIGFEKNMTIVMNLQKNLTLWYVDVVPLGNFKVIS